MAHEGLMQAALRQTLYAVGLQFHIFNDHRFNDHV